METLRQFLEKTPILLRFKEFLGPNRFCYLVGGAVRDAWLGRPVHDFDFATPHDPTSLAQAWARHCRGHWFWLDEERRQSRVVLGPGTLEPTFDFAPFRAADLEGDLRGRDFTFNALAIGLGGDAPLELIDPLDGVADLDARLLRACSPNAFLDDALRVLRAARFAALLDLRLDEDTLRLARAAAPGLSEIAGERIKAELYALFAAPAIAAGLELAAASGALAALSIRKDEVSLKAGIEESEAFFSRIDFLGLDRLDLHALLDTSLEAGLSCAALLRLAVFLRACPPTVSVQELTRRLAAARDTAQRLRAMLEFNLGQIVPPPTERPTPRQLAQWVSRLGREPIDILLFLAGQKDVDARLKELIPQALSAWSSLNVDNRLPPLVDGAWVTRELGVSEGKQVGRLLDQLAEAEFRGLVNTPENARKFLKSLQEKED